MDRVEAIDPARQGRRAIAQHGFHMHFVFSRNGARVDAMFLGQPSHHLAHEAHYVDALEKGSHREFHIWRYLAAGDALGAWG